MSKFSTLPLMFTTMKSGPMPPLIGDPLLSLNNNKYISLTKRGLSDHSINTLNFLHNKHQIRI